MFSHTSASCQGVAPGPCLGFQTSLAVSGHAFRGTGFGVLLIQVQIQEGGSEFINTLFPLFIKIFYMSIFNGSRAKQVFFFCPIKH